MKYIEIAQGHPGNRGKAIEVSSLSNYLNGTPLYRSYYSFDSSLMDYMEQHGSIQGYDGTVYLDEIILDIDKGSDSADHLLDRVRAFIALLINDYKFPENYIQPYFSGNGYHIAIPDVFRFRPDPLLPRIVKSTLVEYFPMADPIYDYARLIRVTYSKNDKTGLYKIPLTIKEVNELSPKNIVELAQKNDVRFKIWRPKVPEKLLEIRQPNVGQPVNITNHYAVNKPLHAVATCVQKMYNEGPEIGTRHDKYMAISSVWMRNGIPEQATIDALKKWAFNDSPEEVERNVHDVYLNEYKPSCKNPLLDEYCDSKCIFYAAKNKGNDGLLSVESVKEIENELKEWIKSGGLDSRIDLKEIFPSIKEPFYLKQGEMMVLIGSTGLGKTSFIQNMIYKLKKKTLWLSLEVNKASMLKRFAQLSHKFTRGELYDYWKNNPGNLSDEFNYITIINEHFDINTLKRLVALESPEIVVIDTLDGLQVPGYDKNSVLAMDKIVDGLREIVDMQRVIVIGVAHPNMSDGRSGMMNVYSGRHSSSIATKSDIVMSIEGENKEAERIIRVNKARDADPFNIKLYFEPETFRFIESPNE